MEGPDEFYDKFSEMAPLFVVQEIPDRINTSGNENL